MKDGGTGDKGKKMEEESALLVIGKKALKLKSFGFYSQENKCNVKRKWLRYVLVFDHSPSSTITGSALFCFLRLSLSGLRAGRRYLWASRGRF